MAQPATRSLGRLSEIAQVMVRHGFGYFLEAHKLTDLLPGRSAEARLAEAYDGGSSARGQHLRELLDELGPTFVKFGQLLSTRPDVVPPDIITELRGLQDDVRPFPFEQAERVIEEDLGNSIDRLFLDFDPVPVAAASIGQVHRATLPNGKLVAVKVQRPGAPRQIEADLVLLYQAARLVKERVRALDFIDAHALVDEFAKQIRQELDYRLEGRNAQTFHRNFAGDPHVRVPKVYWMYTRARVLTLEWLEGTQLADVDTLPFTLEERRDLAYRIAETWMEMIFRHGFFHGDPHPANIMVLEEAGTIGLVDFGAVGKLSDDDMSKLTRHVHRRCAGERRHPAEAPGRARRPLPEGARGGVQGRAARDVLPLLRRERQRDRSDPGDPRGVPADLRDEPAPADALPAARPRDRDARLGRRRAVSGLQRVRGRAAVRARAAASTASRRSGSRSARGATRCAYAHVFREAPFQWHDLMEQVRDGQIEVGFVHKGLDDFMEQTQRVFNRLVIALIVVGGLIGSSLIGVFATGGPHVLGVNLVSVVGFVLSTVLGMWLFWGVVRSGRL